MISDCCLCQIYPIRSVWICPQLVVHLGHEQFLAGTLFGRVYETLSEEETSCTKACICHSIVVEGGLTAASIVACVPGIDPHTLFLVWEGLIYTGNVRQTLQRKYHLQNSPCDPCRKSFDSTLG